MWIWFGIGAFAAYLLMRSKQKRWSRKGQASRGFVRGIAVDYSLDHIKLKSSVLMRVGVAMPSNIAFVIQRENWFSRLLRNFWIGREVDTDLPSFDREFEIQCESALLGPWLQQSSAARGAIKSLFDKEIYSITAYQGQLFLDMNLDQADAENPSLQTELAALLNTIAQSKPPDASPKASNFSLLKRAWPPMLWAYTWAAIAMVAYYVPAFYAYPAMINSGDWRFWIRLGALALSPIIIWLAARWMRDSLVARIVLTEFIFVGTLGFVFGAPIVVERVNIDFATGAQHSIESSVLGFETKTRRGRQRNREYFLDLEPFAPGNSGPARLKVSGAIFRSIRDADSPRIIVQWQMGALGQPIVISEPVLVTLPES
jgi:hypothetical protein